MSRGLNFKDLIVTQPVHADVEQEGVLDCVK
jgi:hypothetical protein